MNGREDRRRRNRDEARRGWPEELLLNIDGQQQVVAPHPSTSIYTAYGQQPLRAYWAHNGIRKVKIHIYENKVTISYGLKFKKYDIKITELRCE